VQLAQALAQRFGLMADYGGGSDGHESTAAYQRFETDAETDEDSDTSTYRRPSPSQARLVAEDDTSGDDDEPAYRRVETDAETTDDEEGAEKEEEVQRLGEEQIRPAPDVHGSQLRTPVANPWQQALLLLGTAALAWRLEPDKWQAFGCLVALLLYSPVVGALIDGMPTRNSHLYNAALAGDARRVETLLERGARVSEGRRINVPCVGRLLYSKTPMLVAAEHGHADCIRALLFAGASPHGGETLGPLGTVHYISPLYIAAAEGHAECVSVLLDSGGASPDIGMMKGPWGVLLSTTPLYVAAEDVRFPSISTATKPPPAFCRTSTFSFLRNLFPSSARSDRFGSVLRGHGVGVYRVRTKRQMHSRRWWRPGRVWMLGWRWRVKTVILSHLYIKTNILPRQARDKHRESSKKGPFSPRARSA
jgi:hypothetical protein